MNRIPTFFFSPRSMLWLSAALFAMGLMLLDWDAWILRAGAWGIWLSGLPQNIPMQDIGPWIFGKLYRLGGRPLVEIVFTLLPFLAWLLMARPWFPEEKRWWQTGAMAMAAAGWIIGLQWFPPDPGAVLFGAMVWVVLAWCRSPVVAVCWLIAGWLFCMAGSPALFGWLVSFAALSVLQEKPGHSSTPALPMEQKWPRWAAWAALLALLFATGSRCLGLSARFRAEGFELGRQLTNPIAPQAKVVITDRSGMLLLMAHRPDLVSPSLALALRNPKSSFPDPLTRLGGSVEAVLLGPESLDHAPLMERLALRNTPKNLVLQKANPVGAIFLPSAGRETPTAAETAVELCALASWKMALGQREAARRDLETARVKDPKNAEAPTRLATIFVEVQRQGEALRMANQAIQNDPSSAPAYSIKSQVLFGGREYIQAYDTARIWTRVAPEDPSAWFQLARFAKQVNARETEVESLKTLIRLAEKSGQPSGGYWIFLGQAHAKNGDAQWALEAFREAIRQPELQREQRVFLQETMERILDRQN